MTAEYTATVAIDVTADDPTDAARKAWDLLTADDGMLPIVEVTARVGGEPVEIDLDEVGLENPIVESPSGWSFRASQENGDQVSCAGCGNPLDDDLPIVNDDQGVARHEGWSS